jgi:hypothetical protein
MRRQARENWLQMRRKMDSDAKIGTPHSNDADKGNKNEQGHSIGDDLDE